MDVIYRYGGIYLDTDVEVIRSLDPLLEDSAFAGMESVDGKQLSINTGLGFGAEKHHPIINEWRAVYQDLSFYQADGTLNLLTTPARTTAQMEIHGFRQENNKQVVSGMTIYPTEYFSPKQYGCKDISVTPNTFSIHHYSETWKSPEEKRSAQRWNSLSHKFGSRTADIICGLYARYKQEGVSAAIKTILMKVWGR